MLTNKTAIITGVSSGIGKSILVSLLHEGCRVHGIVKTAERKAQLEEELSRSCPADILQAVSLHVCNLRHPEQIENFAHSLRKADITPDILILNAGIGIYGPHEELSAKKLTELTAVNFTAPLLLTNLFLRDIKSKQGHILFLSSVTANKTNNQTAFEVLL